MCRWGRMRDRQDICDDRDGGDARDPELRTASRLTALSSALGLGASPWRVIERVRALYRSIDAEVETRAASFDLPCHSGCDACCHEAVFLSAPEFLVVVAELLTSQDSSVLHQIREEMEKLAERFSDELELLDAIEGGPERDEVAARIKFRCPLLDSGGRCSVYGSRELNARTFGLTWDERRDHPFGCTLTHDRLRVVSPSTPDATLGRLPLAGARAARRKLVDAFPEPSAKVQVYPWWFREYADHLEAD